MHVRCVSDLTEEPQPRLMIGPPQQSAGTSPYFCRSSLRRLASISSVVAMNMTFPKFPRTQKAESLFGANST
jgi:hypothetical protein